MAFGLGGPTRYTLGEVFYFWSIAICKFPERKPMELCVSPPGAEAPGGRATLQSHKQPPPHARSFSRSGLTGYSSLMASLVFLPLRYAFYGFLLFYCGPLDRAGAHRVCLHLVKNSKCNIAPIKIDSIIYMIICQYTAIDIRF